MKLPLPNKKSKGKTYCAYAVLILVATFVIVTFSFMQGDHLLNLDHHTVEWVLPKTQIFSDMQMASQFRAFGGRVVYNPGNARAIEEAALAMEHAIHVILFFFMTATFLIVLKILRSKLWVNVCVSGLICGLIAYGSETVQNGIFMRGYESIDVLHNFVGVGIALLLFLIVHFTGSLFRKRKAARGPGPVRIRYFLSDKTYQ